MIKISLLNKVQHSRVGQHVITDASPEKTDGKQNVFYTNMAYIDTAEWQAGAILEELKLRTKQDPRLSAKAFCEHMLT